MICAAVVERRGVKGITLLEHLLFHLKYFLETGNISTVKIKHCVGSRDSGGLSSAVFVNMRAIMGYVGVYFSVLMQDPYSVREVSV